MSTLIGQMIETLTRHPEACSIMAPVDARKTYGHSLRANMIDSHRFHLSSKTAQVASRLGLEAKDAAPLMSLCKLPFRRTWMEWNLADQFAGVGQETAKDAPERVGAMIYEGRDGSLLVTSIMPMDFDRREVLISPISILFNPNKPIEDTEWQPSREIIGQCVRRVARLHDNDEMTSLQMAYKIMDACLVGGAVDNDGEPITFPQQQIVDHATWVFTPYFADVYKVALQSGDNRLQAAMMAIIGERVTETSGMLRFIIGALSLINSKEYVTRQPVKPTDKKPPPEAPKNSKRSPAYEFVEFTAPHKVYVRDIIESQTTDEDPHKPVRPQHEVIGHFAHSRKLGRDDCEHNYEKRAENSWICLNCGKKRWHRKDHLRGDPSIGRVVHKERVVVS